jgi:CheY-like chemotaxis protein
MTFLIEEGCMTQAQRILMLTTWPERFHNLPVATDMAVSIADALAYVQSGVHRAIFVDAVLPGNQSGYRFLRELRRLGMSTGPVFIMAEQVAHSDRQLVRERGASGLIAKDPRAVLKVLQDGQQVNLGTQPRADPRWLEAMIHAARHFLASEAERVVRDRLASLRGGLQVEVSPTALIHAVSDVLDDEEDRIAFTRKAISAIKAIQ